MWGRFILFLFLFLFFPSFVGLGEEARKPANQLTISDLKPTLAFDRENRDREELRNQALSKKVTASEKPRVISSTSVPKQDESRHVWGLKH